MLPWIVSKYKNIIVSWCILEMASSGLDFRLSAVAQNCPRKPAQISVYYRNSDATLLFPHCLILTPVSCLYSVSAPSLHTSIQPWFLMLPWNYFSPILKFVFVCLFCVVSPNHEAQKGLELVQKPRMTLNPLTSCSRCLSAKSTILCHTQLVQKLYWAGTKGFVHR